MEQADWEGRPYAVAARELEVRAKKLPTQRYQLCVGSFDEITNTENETRMQDSCSYG